MNHKRTWYTAISELNGKLSNGSYLSKQYAIYKAKNAAAAGYQSRVVANYGTPEEVQIWPKEENNG